MNSPMEALNAIRTIAGNRQTTGIDDATIARFIELDPSLVAAIEDAARVHAELMTDFADLLKGDEAAASAALQADFINFYPANTVNPYISMAASGPWIVTSHGSVLHDNGGYGMLGAGHSPHQIMEIMQRLKKETGTAFIFATHDPRVIPFARRVVEVRDGQVTENSKHA